MMDQGRRLDMRGRFSFLFVLYCSIYVALCCIFVHLAVVLCCCLALMLYILDGLIFYQPFICFED